MHCKHIAACTPDADAIMQLLYVESGSVHLHSRGCARQVAKAQERPGRPVMRRGMPGIWGRSGIPRLIIVMPQRSLHWPKSACNERK